MKKITSVTNQYIKLNTKIGTITYTYNQEIISTEEVILNIEIKPDYIKILLKYKYYILGFILIIIILIPKKKKRRILK